MGLTELALAVLAVVFHQLERQNVQMEHQIGLRNADGASACVDGTSADGTNVQMERQNVQMEHQIEP